MGYNYNKYKHLSAKKQSIIKNVEDNKDLQREIDRRTIKERDVENLELLKNLLSGHYEIIEEKESDCRYRVALKKEDDVQVIKITYKDNIEKAKKIINTIVEKD